MTGWPAMFALAAVFALGEAVVAWLLLSALRKRCWSEGKINTMVVA